MEQAAVSTGKLVPNANPFSKKRSMAEMTKPSAAAAIEAAPQNSRPVEDEKDDVSMQEEPKSAQSEHKMKGVESAAANGSAPVKQPTP